MLITIYQRINWKEPIMAPFQLRHWNPTLCFNPLSHDSYYPLPLSFIFCVSFFFLICLSLVLLSLYLKKTNCQKSLIMIVKILTSLCISVGILFFFNWKKYSWCISCPLPLGFRVIEKKSCAYIFAIGSMEKEYPVPVPVGIYSGTQARDFWCLPPVWLPVDPTFLHLFCSSA